MTRNHQYPLTLTQDLYHLLDSSEKFDVITGDVIHPILYGVDKDRLKDYIGCKFDYHLPIKKL
jgi:hypothetical protein